MPTRAEVRAVFQHLKPLCVELMEHTTERRIATMQHDSATTQRDELKSYPPSRAAVGKSLNSALQRLHSLLQSQPRLPLLHSLDYLLFPLTSLLSQPISSIPGSESSYLSALSCMSLLLDSSATSRLSVEVTATTLCDSKSFSALFLLLVDLVRSRPAEELLAATATSLTSLLRAAEAQLSAVDAGDMAAVNRLREHIFGPTFHVSLGYLVSLLLPHLSSRSKQLQYRVVQCVAAVVAVLAGEAMGVRMLTGYMPGVLSAVHRLLLHDDKAGSRVKVAALQVMVELTVAVMSGGDVDEMDREADSTHKQRELTSARHEDERKEQETNLTFEQQDARQQLHRLHTLLTPTAATSAATSASLVRPPPLYGFASHPQSDLLVARDSAWYHSTRQRLLLLIRQLFASSSLYPRPARLELAYVRAARCLLEQLARQLRECVIVWVEYVLAMTQHGNEAVRQEANDTLQSIPHALSSPHAAILLSALTPQLHHHLLSLPRRIQSSISQSQLRLLHTITGYMQLIGASTPPTVSNPLFALLTSPAAFPHLFYTILPAFRVDTTQPHIIPLPAATSTPSSLLTSLSNCLHLHYAKDDNTRSALLAVPRSIGRYGGVEVGYLLDALLGVLEGRGGQVEVEGFGGGVLEWLVLINGVLLGWCESGCDRAAVTPYLVLVLDTYLQSPLFTAASNSLLLTQLLTGIATVAHYLQSDFSPYLMHVIFPVLSHLGSTSLLVSSSAATTLSIVASVLSYPSPSALVLSNMDYVVDALASQLLTSSASPASLSVMRAVLGRIEAQEGQLVMLMEDVLMQLMDALNSKMALYMEDDEGAQTGAEEERAVYLEIILSVVRAVRRMYDATPPPLHPSASSGLFSSSAPLPTTLLLTEGDDNYSEFNIASRVQELRDKYRLEDEQQAKEESERKAATSRESPEQWYSRMEAKRQRKEERKQLGLADEDTDSEDDEDDQAAKQRHREWREKEKVDEAVQPTKEQQLVMTIMARCRNWLGRGSVREQSLCVELLCESVVVLRTIPKELFPLIAQLWPLLIAMFKRYQRTTSAPPSPSSSMLVLSSATQSSSAVSQASVSVSVLAQCAELLAVLCETASRFLAPRFHTELWPILSALLTSSHRQLLSLIKLSSSVPTSSSSYRLILSCLSSLSSLLLYRDLMTTHVLSIARTVVVFVSDMLPSAIQQSAVTVLRCCAALDADVVWWLLDELVDCQDDSDGRERVAGEASAASEAHNVSVADWSVMDEWQLDRRGELRLMLHRLTAFKQSRSIRERALQRDGKRLERNARMLMDELRAMGERWIEAD